MTNPGLWFVFLALVFASSCSTLKQTGFTGIRKAGDEKPHFFIVWSKNLDPEFNTGNLPMALNAPLIHKDTFISGITPVP